MVTEVNQIITQCSFCKRIRNHLDKWIEIEMLGEKIVKYVFGSYAFSHTYCPDCAEENTNCSPQIINDERFRESVRHYASKLSEENKQALRLLTLISKLIPST